MMIDDLKMFYAKKKKKRKTCCSKLIKQAMEKTRVSELKKP